MNKEIEILQRRIEREKKARQEAEKLLEKKAWELYQANEYLRKLNESLEKQVQQRTNALRLSEEKYRGIIENIDLGLLEVDNEDRIVRAYKRFCKLTGYEESELIGQKASDILIPSDEMRAIIAQQNQNRLQGNTGVYEMPIRKKNGELIWVIISGAPIIDIDGNVTGSIGIHFDITERKRMLEALEDARQIAEDARKAEKRFLANMSHEIRTPINAIIGMTHLLYDTAPDKSQMEYLSAIHYSADILLNLVSDILDISKIEAGEMKVSERTFSLKNLINSILQTFRLRLNNKPIELVFEFDAEIENDVIGDEILLTQILMNLLSNAVKFTEKGKIGVEVSLLCRLGDFLMTEIKVFDTGIGIKPDKIYKIFDSYRQADQDVRSVYGGTGLGLAIVKQLVHLHGGEIEVESEFGKGTSFTFTLPLKDSGQTVEKLQAITVDISKNWEKYKVLIVEDNLLNQKYLEGLLNKWQITYRIAENGKTGVELAKKEAFDIILMDIRMPEMDGYNATKIIRESEGFNQNTPIIALTASALTEEIETAQSIGMNGYLTKPFTPNQLINILKENLPINPQSESSLVEPPKELRLSSTYLSTIYNNDKKYAADMFSLFLKTVPNQFLQLKPLIHEMKVIEIGKLAHQMKPSFTMVGLPELTQSFQRLEKMAKQDENFEQIKKLYLEIEATFNEKITLIEKELEYLNS